MELIYHTLCQNPRNNLTFALNGFLKALKVKQEYAYRWAQIVYKAGNDTDDSYLKKWGTRLQLIRHVYKNRNYIAVINLFHEILGSDITVNSNCSQLKQCIMSINISRHRKIVSA